MSPDGDVTQIQLAGDTYNAYLVGDVLVDAGNKGKQGRRALEGVAGREVTAHLVSHAHPDHAGGSKQVVDALGVPVWASEQDAPLIEAGEPAVNSSIMKRIGRTRPVPVARRLKDGDEIAAGFVVLATPGHTPGHISLWRAGDRTLLAIDAAFNLNPFTRRRGLTLPPKLLSVDTALMKATIRRLAELEPAVAYFGHGAPLRDPSALKAFAASL
jgi:glyoxylase-like metal-dependent hydrolase (beta-lactamase superfamily II)